VRHRFVGNFVAELPFGQGKPFAQDGVAASVLGGWIVSGIYTAHSGRPFTVTQGTNNVGPGATGLPNVVGDPKGQESVDNWFNVGAFTLVPSTTFGNAGRNTVRGPGWVTFDTSVQRRIDVAGRWAQHSAGTSSTCSTARTSGCPTRTSPAPRCRRLRRSREIRASCSSRFA
jgi:hypothetical protein